MIDTTRACTYSARDTRAVRCVQCTEMGGGIREREVGFLGFSAKLCDERCFETRAGSCSASSPSVDSPCPVCQIESLTVTVNGNFIFTYGFTLFSEKRAGPLELQLL